jgi:hypothetical protein
VVVPGWDEEFADVEEEVTLEIEAGTTEEIDVIGPETAIPSIVLTETTLETTVSLSVPASTTDDVRPKSLPHV